MSRKSRYSDPNYPYPKSQVPITRILFFMMLACLLGSWLGSGRR